MAYGENPPPQMLWLGSHVRLVKGKRAWVVLDLDAGGFVLVNYAGAELLNLFSLGYEVDAAMCDLALTGEAYSQAREFISDAQKNGLLTHKPSELKKPVTTGSGHFGDATLALTIEVTRNCNLECKHCYCSSGPSVKEQLPLDSVKAILQPARVLFDRLSTLILTGGEPLIYPDLDEAVSYGLQLGFETIRINTNGTMKPGPRLAQLLREFPDRIEVQVTLLGASAVTHDSITGRGGSWDRTIRNFSIFRETGTHAFFAFTRTSESAGTEREVQTLCDEIGAEVQFGEVFRLGRAAQTGIADNLKDNDVEEVASSERYRYCGIPSTGIPRDKIQALREDYPPKMPCGRSTMMICANGDIAPCPLLRPIKLGNVERQTLEEVVKSEAMTQFLHQIEIDNRAVCSECELRYVCGSKCPAVAFSVSGDLGIKNPLCSYY